MKVSWDFFVIALVDSQGNSWIDAVKNVGDTIQVDGLVGRDGSAIVYTGKFDEAFLEWRETHWLKCSVTKETITREIVT